MVNQLSFQEVDPKENAQPPHHPILKEPLKIQLCVLNQSQDIFSLDINLLAVSTKSGALSSPPSLPLGLCSYCTDVWLGPVPLSIHQQPSCLAPHLGWLPGQPCGP